MNVKNCKNCNDYLFYDEEYCDICLAIDIKVVVPFYIRIFIYLKQFIYK